MESSAKVTAQTEYFTVIDDFLSKAAFDRLWNFLQIQQLKRVEELGRRGHWLIEDEDTLRGPTAGWRHTWDAQYPTGTPMDDVMKTIVDRGELLVSAIGRYDVDWAIFSAMITVYRAGQGLVWHRDSEANAGSYIFYAHPEWSIDWGGELFLSHTLDVPREYGVFFHKLKATEGLPNPPPGYPHLDNDDANELLMKSGLGSFVVPKPNRIVVIKGGTPHAIAKVTGAAGRNVRASVGGFFKKKGVTLSGPESPYPV